MRGRRARPARVSSDSSPVSARFGLHLSDSAPIAGLPGHARAIRLKMLAMPHALPAPRGTAKP
ncbi:hypothetical protein BGV50_29705 [Burkholderia ubonensis]|nr:hypothetical protein BGV50_29705 [Burkholderia ubonensis]